MRELQTAAGQATDWPSIGAIDPTEVIAVVVTAVAANAFTYGALLQLHGATTLTTTLLFVGGGAVTLASTGWLMVLSFVREVVER